jgi:hypothetical protein
MESVVPSTLYYNERLQTMYVFSAADLYKAFKDALNGKVETLIIEPQADFVDLTDSLPLLINVLKKYHIQNLLCLKVDLSKPMDPSKRTDLILPLRSANFTSCENVGTTMRYLMYYCPKLEELRELGPKLSILNHSYSNWEVDTVSIAVQSFLQDNYRLRSFHYDRLEARKVEFPKVARLEGDLGSLMAQTFQTLVGRDRHIKEMIARNNQGYDKCRKAIYCLLLIKRFAIGDPFKLLNHDVMLIICRMLYASIGTKVWC